MSKESQAKKIQKKAARRAERKLPTSNDAPEAAAEATEAEPEVTTDGAESPE